MNKLFNNEKHYLTLNNYLKDKYHQKVYKISLNGNFSCPNRDGKLSYKGCLFCSDLGSGDFAGDKRKSLIVQFEEVKKQMQTKWHEGSYIAYFQANTNTYDTLENLKKRYDEILRYNDLKHANILILSIATRPDCLSDEIVDYLASLSKKIELWVELGFQTSNELTAFNMNRGYPNDCLVKAIKKLKAISNIKVIVHIINGLPNENESDMLNTIKFLNKLPIDGIKIHMLHVIKNAPLGSIYLKEPFKLLSMEEYVDVVIKQLRLLNENIVIHRITGDADKNELIAPLWTLKKFVVMNEIDKKMQKNNYYQGDLYVENC